MSAPSRDRQKRVGTTANDQAHLRSLAVRYAPRSPLPGAPIRSFSCSPSVGSQFRGPRQSTPDARARGRVTVRDRERTGRCGDPSAVARSSASDRAPAVRFARSRSSRTRRRTRSVRHASLPLHRAVAVRSRGVGLQSSLELSTRGLQDCSPVPFEGTIRVARRVESERCSYLHEPLSDHTTDERVRCVSWFDGASCYSRVCAFLLATSSHPLAGEATHQGAEDVSQRPGRSPAK